MPACHGTKQRPCHMSFARGLDKMPLGDADKHSIHGRTENGWKQVVDSRMSMLPGVSLSTAVKLFCRPTEHLGSSDALMSVLL